MSARNGRVVSITGGDGSTPYGWSCVTVDRTQERRTDRDRELVEALRLHEPTAAERLVATYGDRAYRLARGITGNAEDAEEVVQDVLWTVVRKIDTFRGESAFGSWLYRIVANAAYQKVRGRQSRRAEVSLDDVLPLFDERGRHATLKWSILVGVVVAAQALGRSGRDLGAGVFQMSVPRAEAITENGMPLLPAMGVVTVLNFQAVPGGTVAITDDFVLTDKEVNPVARTLRQHGIDVTAIHNHGLLDTPRLFYMHFWAVDESADLARGLKAALDQTNSQR